MLPLKVCMKLLVHTEKNFESYASQYMSLLQTQLAALAEEWMTIEACTNINMAFTGISYYMIVS